MREFALLLLAASQIAAQSGVTYDLGAVKWRNLGPNRGGRSIAVAGSVRRPLEYYFGATGGGLWKTSDGGTTWQPVTDGQIKSSSVGAVAVSESNPDVVYIGMGEVQLRGNIMQGDGVYKSTNGGKTWSHAGLADSQTISRIRIDPRDPNLVYVAASGHPYGRNDERGVFRSKDGGRTWQKVLFRSDRAGAVDLSIDPNNPRVLYASLWEAYRTPWTLSSGGPGSGLFKSTDGGDTWTEITRNPGLPRGILGKIGVVVSPADSQRVYALVEAEDGGMFVSDNAGASWTRVSEDRKIRQRAFYFSRITADPKNRDTLYALNVELYRSTDGGKTFTQMKAAHADHHDLWIAANDPQRMINGNDGGGAVSINGGETWTGLRYSTAQIYHVVTTKDDPYQVCGAQQDNTTICLPSDTRPGFDSAAQTGDSYRSVARAEAGYVAADPVDPNIFYNGDQAGIVSRFDRRTGETRNVTVYPVFFSGMSAAVLKERWQWTFPIVFSPKSPGTLYTSSQHLWRTTNQGQTWEKISPDLTRNDPSTLGDSGGPITKDQNGPEIYGTIFTIAPSRHDARTIWTGSDDGLIYVTRDGGKNWTNVTPPDLPKFSRVSLIDASPHKPGGAYVAAKRYQLDDLAPYIFRTEDYGKTWTKIVQGIPPRDFVHAVREDIARPGLLYAGTEHGTYVSFDNGASWQSISGNLPDTQVSDLVVEANDLVIGTHGRGFWILDRIGFLRQLSPEVLEAGTHLFDPGVIARPAREASIDYYLARPGDVTLDISDASGRTVRTLKAAGKAGINRLTWDLRYRGATAFEGLILRAADPQKGPIAPPGNYTLRFSASGATRTGKLQVARNPRLISSSDADLQEQFRLAIQVRDKTSEANEAVIRIRAMKKQIADRIERAPNLAGAGNSVAAKLSQVEEEIYQTKNRSARDTLNYPIKLNNQLAVLFEFIDTGDYRPTDQSYAVFKELSAKVESLRGQLNEVLNTDLARFNEQLRSAGLVAVSAQEE